ncbi:PASTA domain-containing protein [Streptomyces sp. LS1784]|uniref:PASTA domain-containing protein n=1 Tax=Streptomyces sp. LS1784 TaxID=2851533 RepID=UPI0035A8FF01
MVLKQEEVPMRDGFDIGIGVAMATGSPMALGAVGNVTPPAIGPGGAGSRGLFFRDSAPSPITQGSLVLEGEVVGQNPAAGTTVDIGTVVELEIGNYHEHQHPHFPGTPA